MTFKIIALHAFINITLQPHLTHRFWVRSALVCRLCDRGNRTYSIFQSIVLLVSTNLHDPRLKYDPNV